MNKIVLAQINPIAGDIEGNAAMILDCVEKAKKINASAVIFPELSLPGYPFGDIMLRHEEIIVKQQKALENIAAASSEIAVIVGFARSETSQGEKKLYDSVAVIQNGKLEKISDRKSFIPKSCFCPSRANSLVFDLDGEKCAVVIGEDIRNNAVLDELMSQKPSILVNCACAPSRAGEGYVRNKLLSEISVKYGVSTIFVNRWGYSDNFCFDGSSRIYAPGGRLTLRAESFAPDFAVAENLAGSIKPIPEGSEKEIDFSRFNGDFSSDLDRTYKSIVCAIKEYFFKNGFKKAVLGLSGGLDSSVCAVLLTDALGKENVCGISMPSKITSSQSKNDAAILAEKLGINFFEVPLAEVLEPSKTLLDGVFAEVTAEKYEKSTTVENLQARTRATILWSVSNECKNMLPIATSDKSEAYIGYATVNGDMSGGFAPIADVTKTKLFALAAYLNSIREVKNAVPQSVLEKPPGAELKLNPKTGKPVSAEEDNMPYEFLDEIIMLVENCGFGFEKLINHEFYSEKKHPISREEKLERINKFFRKSSFAVYKWHIMPASVITDARSINSAEYYQPIISKIKQN